MYWPYVVLVLTSYTLPVLGASSSYSCTAINPLPSGCGIRGIVMPNETLYYYASDSQLVSSLDHCAELCGLHGAVACQSFEYDSKTGFCRLGRLNTQAVQKNSKSDLVFYNQACFKCGNTCPQSYGVQLLANGGFEEIELGPWYTTDASLSKGFKSAHAFHCAENDLRGCALHQSMDLCQGYYYAFKFDYVIVHTNTSLPTPQLSVDFGGTGYQNYSMIVASSNNTDPNAWQSIGGYFQLLADTPGGPRFSFLGGGAISIDNVHISRVPVPQAMPSADNVIVNGDFESGSLAPWTSSNNCFECSHPFKIVSPGINSTYAIFYGPTFYPSLVLEETISTKPNTSYIFSADVIVRGYSWELNINLGPEDGSSSTGNSVILTTNATSFSVPLFATSEQTLVSVQAVTADEGAYGGNITVDNIKMVEAVKGKYFL